MIEVFGQREYERVLGCVADKCPHCSEVTVQYIVQQFRRVYVFYLIPFGDGNLVGTMLNCIRCNGKSIGSITGFDRYLPVGQVPTLTLAEILQLTNHRLAGKLTLRAELEQAAVAPDVARRHVDARLQLAFVKLADLDIHDAGVLELFVAFTRWEIMTAGERDELLARVDQRLAQRLRREEAELFLGRLARKFFREDVDAGWAVLAFVAILIMGFFGSHLLTKFFGEGGWLCLTGLGTIVVAILVAVSIQRRVRRRFFEEFFRTTFREEAARQQHDLDLLAHRLQEIRGSNVALPQPMRKLAEAATVFDAQRRAELEDSTEQRS